MWTPSDETFFSKALELARKGVGKTSPNPAVGAVVVKGGKILGKGYHKRAGTPHAEPIALKQAGTKARGATLYVTLEPCCHTGKTPPCTEAILKADIRRVVVGIRDQDRHVAGKGIRILRSKGVKVDMAPSSWKARCHVINEEFFVHREKGRPFVALKSAMTLDGKIATSGGKSRWITGEKARLFGHTLRDRYDAILVGADTVIRDNPRLSCRLGRKKVRQPVRIVLDGKLRVPVTAKVFQGDTPCLLLTTRLHTREKVSKAEKLARKGVIVIELPSDRNRSISPREVLKKLNYFNIMSILVEGGGVTIASFIRAKLADRYYLFKSPKLFGEGKNGIGRLNVSEPSNAPELKDISIQAIGEDILISGRF